MTRQAILDRLNAEAPGLRKKYGVKSLSVFGSIARGDDHEEATWMSSSRLMARPLLTTSWA